MRLSHLGNVLLPNPLKSLPVCLLLAVDNGRVDHEADVESCEGKNCREHRRVDCAYLLLRLVQSYALHYENTCQKKQELGRQFDSLQHLAIILVQAD